MSSTGEIFKGREGFRRELRGEGEVFRRERFDWREVQEFKKREEGEVTDGGGV